MGTPKNPGTTIMFTLVLISLSLANSLPIQDTEEVAAAKAEFAELFAAAEAGDHAALAPVNNDVQEDQIASAYIEDTEDVAAAKAAFNAAFEEAKSGGLAAKQAAAPVHVVADPVLPTYTNVPLSYNSLSFSPYSYAAHHVATPAFHNMAPYYASPTLPHLSIPAFGLHGLPYNGLPYSGLPYSGVPAYAYTGLPTLAYNTLASAPAEEKEE